MNDYLFHNFFFINKQKLTIFYKCTLIGFFIIRIRDVCHRIRIGVRPVRSLMLVRLFCNRIHNLRSVIRAQIQMLVAGQTGAGRRKWWITGGSLPPTYQLDAVGMRAQRWRRTARLQRLRSYPSYSAPRTTITM